MLTNANIQSFPSDNAIRYSAAIQALPDLPRWLSLTQSEDGHLAFLHGTPELGDLGVDIKVSLTFD